MIRQQSRQAKIGGQRERSRFQFTSPLLRFYSDSHQRGQLSKGQTQCLHLGTLERRYLSDPRKDWEGVIAVRPPTALRKQQPECGGIQRPRRSCHLWGYHNYPWGWAQPQVTNSIDTMSTLSITTLATYDNQSIRSNGDPVPKYKHYT